jgi:hypothetical protein
MLFLPAGAWQALTVLCTNVSGQLDVFEVGHVLEPAISTSVRSTLRTGLVTFCCTSGYNVGSYQLSSKLFVCTMFSHLATVALSYRNRVLQYKSAAAKLYLFTEVFSQWP